MASLYEFTAAANELYELLQSEEIDDQTFLDTLEAMGANDKVESYCQIIKQFQNDVEMYKSEIDRVTAKKRAAENAIDRMKNALLNFMKQSGQKKVSAGTFIVSTANSQSVNIIDESKLPKEYLIEQPPKVDKAGIKKAISGGAVIDGAEIVVNEGVRIR